MIWRRWLREQLGVPTVRAIRGAITVADDSPAAIREAVLELLHAVRSENLLDDRDVVSAIFTMTPDLTAAFPAKTARQAGWGHVPLLCMQEIAVPGGMPRCLRLLAHVQRDWGSVTPRHSYLRGAAALRPDLVMA